MSRPNLLRTPIGKDDIKDYLASADDFQLEIDVFRACLDAGFHAEHSGSYKDPITNLNRQFDVRAVYESGECFLKLAIECKALADFFPLVVSRVPRRAKESSYQVLLSAKGSGGPRIELLPIKQGLFPQGAPVGKATTQLGRKDQNVKPPAKPPFHTGDAEVYEKWAQAIASAHDLVAESVTDFMRSSQKWSASLILPVLVVADEALWVVDYSETGDIVDEPKMVDECSIYLNTFIEIDGLGFPASYPVSHLLVFTKKGFFDLLQRFVNRGMVRDYLLPDSKDVRDAVKTKFGDLP